MQTGATQLPNLLALYYKKIGLSDLAFTLIVHLLTFQSRGNYFPTIHELQERMSATERDLINVLQRLVADGFIQIKQTVDEPGVLSERYDLQPLFQRISAMWLEEERMSGTHAEPYLADEEEDNLFTVFEGEFGRPLSPIEAENISIWLDEDGCSKELILEALKEAVLNGKLSIRYIDRILFEWQKRNIKTPAQAREFAQRFRLGKTGADAAGQKKPAEKGNTSTEFPFYNWLEGDEPVSRS
jgi:DNA replication protein